MGGVAVTCFSGWVLIHLCWMCKSKTGHQQVVEPRLLGNEIQLSPNDRYAHQLAVSAYGCTVCQGISVALASVPPDRHYYVSEFFETLRGEDLLWRPNAGETRTYSDVPDHIAEAATEAYECHAQQHYRAAISLARSVIEATAKEKGITSGTLQQKIDALEDKGHIRPLFQQAAHGVRMFGNDMAHGDFVQPITEEESWQVIELMGDILNEVFQQPTRVERVQAAVDARKQVR